MINHNNDNFDRKRVASRSIKKETNLQRIKITNVCDSVVLFTQSPSQLNFICNSSDSDSILENINTPSQLFLSHCNTSNENQLKSSYKAVKNDLSQKSYDPCLSSCLSHLDEMFVNDGVIIPNDREETVNDTSKVNCSIRVSRNL